MAEHHAASLPAGFGAFEGQTISGRFDRIADAFRDQPSICDREHALSYAQLQERITLLGHAIRARDRGDQAPWALFASGFAAAIGLMALLRAGKTVAVLDPSHPVERLKTIFDDCRPSVVVTEARCVDRLVGAAELRADCLLIDQPESLAVRDPPNEPPAACEGALILYTSGSQGRPKGVLQPERNILADVLQFSQSHGISNFDRISHLLSSSVRGGLREILSALLNGACLLPFQLQSGGLEGFSGWLRSENVSVCRLVSSLLRSWLHSLKDEDTFPALRLLYVGGEALLARDADQVLSKLGSSCTFANLFGATEYGVVAQHIISGPVDRGSIVPVGTLLPGYRIRIVDESGAELGRSQAGELVVESPYVSPGYLNRAELNDRCFCDAPGQPGWRSFVSGDLCRINADGLLEHLGRCDDQVQIRGNRVEPGEVEGALVLSPAVEDAVVLPRRQGDGIRLRAYVKTCAPVTVRELREWCQARLPEFMIPAEIRLVDNLPRTAQGKIDRRALDQESEPPAPDPVALKSAADTMDSRVRHVWERVLGARNLAPDADFFESGGDSIQALDLVLELNRSLGVELRPEALVASSRLSAMVQTIHDHLAARSSRDFEVLRPGTGSHTLYLLHTSLGDLLCYRHLVRLLPAELPIVGIRAPFDRLAGSPFRFEQLAQMQVDELCRFQPDGPLHLAGFSFGGLLALEMARKLAEKGRKVQFLGMIDPHIPFGLRRRMRYQPLALLRFAWRTLTRLPSRDTPVTIAPKDPAPAATLVGIVRRRRKYNGRPGEGAADDRLADERLAGTLLPYVSQAEQAIAARMMDAIDAYIPGRYEGRISVYAARERPPNHTHRPGREWRKLTGADVLETRVAGSHTTIMRLPCVEQLAAAMGAHLLPYTVSKPIPAVETAT